jgi:hypothetical protein
MPNELTNFHQELNNPNSGNNSELFSAVSPLLNLQNIQEPKNKFDAERINKLKDAVRRGMVGLEYLTGLKSNKAETFYDKHPVQATISNLLANSGNAGLTTALAVPAVNAVRQAGQLKKMVNSYDSRVGDASQSMLNKLAPMEGGSLRVTDPSVLNTFGSLDAEHIDTKGKGVINPIEKRLKYMDLVSGGKTNYSGDYKKLKSLAAKKKFLSGLVGTQEHNILGDYAEMHKGLSTSGKKLKAPLFAGAGDWIREKIPDELKQKNEKLYSALSSVLPSKHQPIKDWANRVLGDLPEENKSPALMNAIFEQALKKPRGHFSGVGEDIARNPYARTIPAKILRHLGPGAVVGGGIAAGGLGLHAALKALQNEVYGKEQIKEWKRNLLRSKGQFEEANRIK